MLLDTSETLVTGSADNTVKVWDVQYGKEKMSVETKTAVRAVAFAESEGNSACDKTILYVTDARMGFPAMLVIYSIGKCSFGCLVALDQTHHYHGF